MTEAEQSVVCDALPNLCYWIKALAAARTKDDAYTAFDAIVVQASCAQNDLDMDTAPLAKGE